MTCKTDAETRTNVTESRRECGRVIRESGTMDVFDVSPWRPVWHAKGFAGDRARKELADELYLFFQRYRALQRLASAAICFEWLDARNVRVSPFPVFAPTLSLPGLKVPRFVYPWGSRCQMVRARDSTAEVAFFTSFSDSRVT